MKSLRPLLALLVLIPIAFSVSATKPNLIVVTGGHKFNRTAFFEMFDSFHSVAYTEVQHPEAISQIGKSDHKTFDVIVFYDMPGIISEEEKAIFSQLTSEGKGLVFLHHSLCSYQNWGDYKTIVGGKYHEEQNSPATSTYQHDVEFSVIIANPKHPVTRGLEDFDLQDEIYGNTEVLPGVEILLTTNHPDSNRIIGWTHQVKNSNVVYIQPGHDEHAFSNTSYRKLIEQAIKFAIKARE